MVVVQRVRDAETAGRSAVRREALIERMARWRAEHGLSVPGSLLAILGYVTSLTPSLLPRPWYFQGLIAGICALIGYALGVVVGWVGHRLGRLVGLRWSIDPRARRVLLWLRLVLVAAVVVGFPLSSLQWQARTASYVGLPGPGVWFVLGSAAAATLVFAFLLGLWRLIVRLDRLVSTVGHRLLPTWAAQAIAVVVVTALVVAVLGQVVLRGVFDYASSSAQSKNRTPPAGLSAPTSSLRSGGPGSYESWQSLGQEGDKFVSGGPTVEDIEQATGRSAVQPIRAYAGLSDGRSIADTANAVVRELERTGAFRRKAIAVMTTTGTGWVNEWHASAFEYLEGGDCAIAAMQYSLLPSSIALFAAGSQPPAAGRLLYDAVAARVAALPEGSRPRLYAAGESLGAFGSQAAFGSPDEALQQLSGAVWSGTPQFTPLRRQVQSMRGLGSTEVNPVVQNGRHFRFVADTAQLEQDQFGRPLGEWAAPRIVYVQHPSDPVVWWSWDLLWSTPGWLQETRGDNATSQMSWYPFVTFWQVTADLTNAQGVPYGFGHHYGPELVPDWAAVLDVTDIDLDRVVVAIRTQSQAH